MLLCVHVSILRGRPALNTTQNDSILCLLRLQKISAQCSGSGTTSSNLATLIYIHVRWPVFPLLNLRPPPGFKSFKSRRRTLYNIIPPKTKSEIPRRLTNIDPPYQPFNILLFFHPELFQTPKISYHQISTSTRPTLPKPDHPKNLI